MDENYLSNIWQFSSSSELYLQRLQNSIDCKETNKWLGKFKNGTKNIRMVEEPVISESDKPVIEEEKQKQLPADIIDLDPVNNFTEIIHMCTENTNTYCLLANSLSYQSIEKLYNYILNTNVNKTFLEHFYKLTLPIIFKKEYSIDLLLKIYEHEEFKIFLQSILCDKEVPCMIMQEFIKTLNSEEKTKLIQILINIDLPREIFIYHLFTLYTAYKDCIKIQSIQDYIHAKLAQIAEDCVQDKNYGRLLLAYVQSQKSLIKIKDIEELINIHRSPFKRPCLNSLTPIVNK